uniref:pyridoxal kinase n=1 Tax=Chenopodium quinoa TaxID=63459 RepID=A0A803M471_CHEQI
MAQPPILSIALPSETGRVLRYPTFKGQVLNGKELWDLIEGLEANNLLFYTHLLTGYIGSVSFLDTVLKVVTKLRTVNPGLLFVCDPVMGDEGKLYVPEDLVSVYRQKVVPVASMLTPNQFEAELLTGLSCDECGMMTFQVVITSIHIDGNLYLIGSSKKEKDEAPEQFKIMIPKIPAYFTKYPDNLARAAELAVSSLQALLHKTMSDYSLAGFDPKTSSLEIRLIQSQDDIRDPQVKFNAEKYS